MEDKQLKVFVTRDNIYYIPVNSTAFPATTDALEGIILFFIYMILILVFFSFDSLGLLLYEYAPLGQTVNKE
jgi:hypothetical protein